MDDDQGLHFEAGYDIQGNHCLATPTGDFQETPACIGSRGIGDMGDIRVGDMLLIVAESSRELDIDGVAGWNTRRFGISVLVDSVLTGDVDTCPGFAIDGEFRGLDRRIGHMGGGGLDEGMGQKTRFKPLTDSLDNY